MVIIHSLDLTKQHLSETSKILLSPTLFIFHIMASDKSTFAVKVRGGGRTSFGTLKYM